MIKDNLCPLNLLHTKKISAQIPVHNNYDADTYVSPKGVCGECGGYKAQGRTMPMTKEGALHTLALDCAKVCAPAA